jgi:thiosulfate reductase/polysulfide reductase chain A
MFSEPKLSRRKFLAYSGGVMATAVLASNLSSLKAIASKEGLPQGKVGREFVFSSCEVCVNKCGLIAEVNNGVIRKLNPNPYFFKSRGMLCARGNAGAKFPYDPDRVKKPLMRVGERGEGKWKEISWEEAYKTIASRVMDIIKKYDNRSAIAFASTEGFQEAFFKHLPGMVGSVNVVRHPTLCLSSVIQGFSSVFGTYPDADLPNTKFVIMSGANRAESIYTPDTIDIAKKHKDQVLIYIDPRATKTVALADKWYPIKPGTDMAVVLAMMNVIIAENLYNKEFVEKYTVGFAELAEHVKQYTPEWAEKESEIPASEIYWLAREFAKNAPASVWYPGRRTSWYAHDVYFRKACATLNAICGCWDRPGGLMPKGSIAIGKHDFDFLVYDKTETERIDMGSRAFIKDLLPEYARENAGLLNDQVAYLGESDGSWIVFREAILRGQPYPVKGLFVYKQNPVESVPNRKKTIQMLKQMDFIVTIDHQMSDTAWYSDIVLPESTYLERWDPAETQGGVVPIAVARKEVIKPVFDTKPMREIAIGLAKAFLEIPGFFDDAEDPEEAKAVFEDYIEEFSAPREKQMAKQFKMFPGGFEMLEKKGVFYLTDSVKYGATLQEGYMFKTKSGKIELYSEKYKEKGLDPLPVYRRPAQIPSGQFRFVVGRHGQFTHAGTQNSKYLLDAFGDKENSIWINSRVAAERGIKNGDRVKVKSKVGEQVVKAYVTEFTRPDTVYYVHGFGRLSKGLTNLYQVGASDAEILVDYVETISGNTLMHETFVEIQKI